jgi:hypothetical protein
MLTRKEDDDFKDEINRIKKSINIDDEEIDDDLDIEIDDEEIDVIEIDDDEDIDVIEIDNIELISKENDDIVLSKHKVEGRHSLKHDSIFKGKKEEIDDENTDNISSYFINNIEVGRSSLHYQESVYDESYVRSKLVKERVYDVLSEHTSINFLNNRRKPSRVDFNKYYNLLVINLKSDGFTNVELFNELSVYFSDNLFNMFKLLDNKWRNSIIDELQDHIGKNKNSKEITNRNIYEGTEIEFNWIDPSSNKEMLITGVIIETYYEDSKFKVNSYENIYIINLENISKILNNTKFKYNLNKLNNIDFL